MIKCCFMLFSVRVWGVILLQWCGRVMVVSLSTTLHNLTKWWLLQQFWQHNTIRIQGLLILWPQKTDCCFGGSDSFQVQILITWGFVAKITINMIRCVSLSPSVRVSGGVQFLNVCLFLAVVFLHIVMATKPQAESSCTNQSYNWVHFSKCT